MTKEVYDLLLKLEECDDFHNRCDYLLEHDEITYLLEYIKMIKNEKNQSIKYKQVIDKIRNCMLKDISILKETRKMSNEEMKMRLEATLKILEEIE